MIAGESPVVGQGSRLLAAPPASYYLSGESRESGGHPPATSDGVGVLRLLRDDAASARFEVVGGRTWCVWSADHSVTVTS